MSDLDPQLKAIAAGKAKQVYLLVGEEFLVRQAAEALVAALVPKELFSLNVTVMDSPGATDVSRDLATAPMFRGNKVVWVREPEFLLPKKGRTDALGKARDAWNAGRRKEAARRVLGIASRAGWGTAELDSGNSKAVGAKEWKSELDLELSDTDFTFLTEVARFCIAENVTAPEGDASALEALLGKGIPKGHTLVVEASTLDAKSGLCKKLLEVGEKIERKVERELRKLDIHEHALTTLKPFKKKISRDAEEALKALCGGNMRLLQSELEKLALYIGERSQIEADDVRLLVRRSREEEYTELANALQARDLKAALRYTQDAMEQGAQPLAILGGIAAVLRRLVEDKERYTRMSLSPRLNYRDFQEDVYPQLAEDAKAAGKKAPHAYVCFLGWQAQARFGRDELVGALLAAGECDLELKSSAPARVSLERLMLQVCQKAA